MRNTGLLILVLFAVTGLSFAAPAMWGIAVNNKTKECAGYWSGDEFTHYDLPAGWTAYYSNKVVIEGRSCEYSYTHEKECCEQLGYVFVNQNIGERQTGTELGFAGANPFFFVLVLVALVAVILLAFITFKWTKK